MRWWSLILVACNGVDKPVEPTPTPTPVVVDTEVDEDSDAGPIAPDTPQSTAPNILLIIADDVGIEKIGAYGAHPEAPPTPFIDGLAAEGLRFERAWSAPVCSPTRSTIFTGQHAFRHGLGKAINDLEDTSVLPDGVPSLPAILEAQRPEYTSALVGKWHLSSTVTRGIADPLHRGFDHHRGAPANLRATGAIDGLPQDFFDFEKATDGVMGRRVAYATTDEVDDALDYIATLPEPWFIVLAFHAPHKPFHAPPGTRPPGLPGPFGGGWTNPTMHDAMLTYLDQELGRVLPATSAEDVVVFLGDNGTPQLAGVSTDQPLQLKGTVYEGGVRVPLILRGPGITPGVTRSLAYTVDLFPTLLELAGATVPDDEDIDGRSLLPVLADPETSVREHVFTSFFDPNGMGPYTEHDRAIRDDRFKLIRSLDAPDELYDLGDDLREGDNLLSGELSAEAAAAYAALSARLDQDVPDAP